MLVSLVCATVKKKVKRQLVKPTPFRLHPLPIHTIIMRALSWICTVFNKNIVCSQIMRVNCSIAVNSDIYVLHIRVPWGVSLLRFISSQFLLYELQSLTTNLIGSIGHFQQYTYSSRSFIRPTCFFLIESPGQNRLIRKNVNLLQSSSICFAIAIVSVVCQISREIWRTWFPKRNLKLWAFGFVRSDCLISSNG